MSKKETILEMETSIKTKGKRNTGIMKTEDNLILEITRTEDMGKSGKSTS